MPDAADVKKATEEPKKSEEPKKDDKPAWLLLAMQIGIPSASSAVAAAVTKNPIVALTVAGGLGTVSYATKYWLPFFDEKYKKWCADKQKHGVGGFREKYEEHLIFRHRNFDVKGLSTQGPHALTLEKVYVDLRMDAKTANKASMNPINPLPTELATGRHSIWDYLKASETIRLAIIGAPGSGKTTLLKFVALRLAAETKEKKRLPILLFLRDHAKAIAEKEGYSLVTAVEESLKRWDGPTAGPGWFETELKNGYCVVLLDGLDEVADPETRKKVIAWTERQMTAYGKCPFVVTSRPHGYRDNPLDGVNVLEVLPFTRSQQEAFLNNWYLANEIMRQGKEDGGVRMEAHEGAQDLLKRLKQNMTLSELAVNPLLLTMIATVHKYRSSLPGRRVELYGEICEVFLGKRREALGLTDELTPIQKQGVLQNLAWEMMRRKTRELAAADAQSALTQPLLRVKRDLKASEFLTAIENGSGLLLQRENGRYGFAHLTFQEFLAAVYAQEQNQIALLKTHVGDSWWHETIRLYCARASDATPILEACLDNLTADSLALAMECEEEAREVHPDIRARLQQTIAEWAEDQSPLRNPDA